MGGVVRWSSTRIDLFGDEGRFRVVRTLRVREGARVVSEVEVTPGEFAGERVGGFSEAFGVARRVSGGGERVRVRVFKRDRWRRRRLVWVRGVELGERWVWWG